MITPYDWQEGIGNRAQYIEGKLEHGSPVIAVSLDAGVLVYTRRRQSRKIYEIYDRLVFAAIGQQSDIEALRSAAVEFAHQEGYNRSEQDVTIQRVVTAMSAPVKKAFSDFSTAPLVARTLFVEANESVGDDRYYVLNYDGDYQTLEKGAVVAGKSDIPSETGEKLAAIAPVTKPDDALKVLRDIWTLAASSDEDDEEAFAGLSDEAVLVERASGREDRFRILAGVD